MISVAKAKCEQITTFYHYLCRFSKITTKTTKKSNDLSFFSVTTISFNCKAFENDLTFKNAIYKSTKKLI